MSLSTIRPNWCACLPLVLLLPLVAPHWCQAREGHPGLVAKAPAEGRFVKTDRGFMVAYSVTIPGTDVAFRMEPIPGGRFTMGSPEREEGREDHEGPQFTVEVEPFWMGRHEVTWGEYKPFMEVYNAFKDLDTLRVKLRDERDAEAIAEKARVEAALEGLDVLGRRLRSDLDRVDAITAPTKLYDPSHTFEFGEHPQQAAVTMTPYAAKQYTKWLSKLAGQFFRLPTEAEWEYACRAGTKTAYHFGDDPAGLEEHAWYYENAEEGQAKVGLKKPNPWGLHDMHGNVAEWCLDEFREEGYKQFAGKTLKAADAVVWPTQAYPRVARGGHWDSDPEGCRAAARIASDDEAWKAEDPNLPKSPWWFTDDPVRGIGFRVIRPLGAPDAELRKKVWEIDDELIQLDVDDRLAEGRGAEDVVTPDLPQVIDELTQAKKRLAESAQQELAPSK